VATLYDRAKGEVMEHTTQVPIEQAWRDAIFRVKHAIRAGKERIELQMTRDGGYRLRALRSDAHISYDPERLSYREGRSPEAWAGALVRLLWERGYVAGSDAELAEYVETEAKESAG
jgi:hypothetical protein